MLRILLVLIQVIAIFFLLVSGILLILYNEKKKKSVSLWGKGLCVWALASFSNIFAYAGIGDLNLAFYMFSRLVVNVAFILFLFHGTLTLLVPSKQSKILSIFYFIVCIVIDFTINMVVPERIWDNVAMRSIYLSMPLTIVFFSYFYTYYMQLKQSILLKMSLAWGALFTMSLFSIIFVSMGLVQFMQYIFIIEYLVMIFLAFTFDSFRKVGETWEKVTTPKSYVVDSDLLDFLNKEFHRDTKPIIETMLAKHSVQSISELKMSGQKEIFIDNLLNNNFPELSPQRKSILKTKIIDILGLNASHWRTAENPYEKSKSP